MRIIYSPQFAKKYKKLTSDVKDIAQTKETIFRKDPFDSRLKTHKLQGKLSDFWAFSIDFRHRVIFEFGEDGTVYFHSVGTHDIYE